MVERFLFYCTTENQGLHNRKSGFFKYVKYLIFGLHNRKSGFQPTYHNQIKYIVVVQNKNISF